MPELPDITVYIEALEARVLGTKLEGTRLASPFVLRTFAPRPADLAGRSVTSLARMGKRIVFGFEGDHFLVVHLMKAGRFRWIPRDGAEGARVLPPIPKKLGLAAFDFERGTLILTEAGTKRRASLHLFVGKESLAALDPGGLEVEGASPEHFAEVLVRENHTLKRALTDPHIFSGIGNAYSDEILHRARLSPVRLTSQLKESEIEGLRVAILATFDEWTARLRKEMDIPRGFPEKVTAFRPEMRVHGRFKLPCPDCGAPVQRIVYAESETDYCANCQTGGKLLADRSLSRLLRDDWPRSIEELEERKATTSVGGAPAPKRARRSPPSR